jgi:putative tryptophan/tyrosine transport system permease protein
LRESHDPIHSTWRVSLGLSSGLKPSDMKLATAVFVLATLALPAFGRRGAARETIRV